MQEKKLYMLEETVMKLEQQLPQDQITTLYEEKVQEERYLEDALEKEKITSDSLSYMCANRKVLSFFWKIKKKKKKKKKIFLLRVLFCS